MKRSILILLQVITSVLAAGCTTTARDPSKNPPKDPSKGTVKFVVTVPHDTPPNDAIFISGNLEQLGNWNGQGLMLWHTTADDYAATIELPRGTTLEYKVTRGSWSTVEKGASGEEVPNRTLTVERDTVQLINVASWRKNGSSPEPKKSTVTGDVRYHDDFASQILGNSRRLIVWLPPGYEKDAVARYPVLYMHDGQNVFDDATSFSGEWHADETATRLIAEGRIRPMIIVAIENAGPARIDEYTPTKDEDRSGATTRLVGGRGEEYAQFLITEVKPFIDWTYRTLPDREHTTVCGSSLGGLISLYLGWKHHDVFGGCGVMSPSLQWSKRNMLFQLEVDNKWMKQTKLWVDMGTDEGSLNRSPAQNMREVRELYSIMLRTRLKPGTDFVYKEVEGARHDEKGWSERFDQVLLFFFGK